MQQNKDSSQKMHFLIGPHHSHKTKIERIRKDRMAVVKINPEFFFVALTLINSGISKTTEEEESFGRRKNSKEFATHVSPPPKFKHILSFFAQ